MPTIYLVRHGQTLLNVERRLQGCRGDSPLTDLGVEQAKRAGQILEAILPGDRALRVASSPLGRAKSTAAIVLTVLGRAPDAYAVDDRLRELDFGDWTSLNIEEIRRSYGADRAAYDADPWSVPPPHGESYADVAQRAMDWLRSQQEDTIAVGHGAWGRILRGAIMNLDGPGIRKLEEPHDAVFQITGDEIVRHPERAA